MDFEKILCRGTAPMFKAAVTACAFVVTGCASGPDYHPPALPKMAEGSFVSQSRQLNGDISPPPDWWKLYDDAGLDSLVQEALTANTDIRVALANLDRAGAVYQEARGGLLPSTNVTLGANSGRDQTAGGGEKRAPTQWTYRGGLEISYELDFFGRVRRDIDAARYDAEAIAEAYGAVKVYVAAETTRAYVDACAYGNSVAVARDSVKLARLTLGLVSGQEHAGSASRLQVERAEAALAHGEAAIPVLLAQKNAALFGLAALMGRTPSQIPEFAYACHAVPTMADAIPVGDGTAMLRRRPDIRRAERQLAADTARTGVAVADLYPRITFGASGNYLRNDSLRGNRTWSFGLGPLVSWSFPNTTIARSLVAQTQAQSAASLAQFDGAVLTALKETEQALSTYIGALAQRDALIQAKTREETALRLTEQRYRAGSIGYLDLLTAQDSLLGTRSQLAFSDQQVSSARVSVFKALGGKWQ